MSRYIDVECNCVTEVINRRAFNSREDVQDFLDNIPTADVAPVKHGRWIFYPKPDYFKCFICGMTIAYKHGVITTNGESKYKYCPNCGARMDGDNT